MKMQIVTCPRCGTYLFDDTSECHGCGHVISEHTGVKLKARVLPSDTAVQEDMQNCPNCGESCRTGLVRCWNCSAFLRPEIEETYRRMRESGQYEVQHVELPILEATSVTEEDSLKRRVNSPDSYLEAQPFATEDFSGDDDFELSNEAQLSEVDDDEFDLSEDLQLAVPSEDDLDSNDVEVFRLQASTVDTPAGETDVIEDLPVEETVEPDAETIPLSVPALSDADAETIPLASEPVASDLAPIEDVTPAVAETPIEAPASPEDELLKIAADEEQDIQRVRKTLRAKDTFVIFCPQGCRIRVKEKHRGKSGRCPRCGSEFVVPRKLAPKKVEAKAGAAAAAAEPVIASKYLKWLNNVRLHTVDPVKLRIKADSLLHECVSVDVGFSTDDLLIANLMAVKFAANNPKKIQPLRQALIEHFLKGGNLDTLKVAAKSVYTRGFLPQLSLAQPAAPGTESLFANIPVFGTNRIAVRLPRLPDETHSKYLSFCLSEFRAFTEGLETVLGLPGFGRNTGLPMSDEYKSYKCHLSQAQVRDLLKIEYYQKDPGFKLEVSGWKCAACGIVVSEAARAEAKLGGANGKAIAKAKCPKCSLKYGNLPLYQLVGEPAEKPAQEPAVASV